MSQKKSYQKPMLAKISLIADYPVANDCWSPNAEVRHFNGWYNTPQYGGIKFLIDTKNDSSCGSGGTSFSIVDYIGNNGETITADTFYAHHPDLNDAKIEQACVSNVQGNWPGFQPKEGAPISHTPPDWPWSE